MPASSTAPRPDQLVFLTRSTSVKCLSNGEFNSSSQAYEAGLLRALSQIENVRVHCLGLHAVDKGSEQVALDEKLTFESFGTLGLISTISLVIKIISIRSNMNTVILTTGYYPLEMLVMLFMRAFGVASYSVVFDTHLTSTSKMGALKRVIVNIYFGLGYWVLKRLNGVIVLNERLLEESIFNNRKFKTRIGGLFRLPAMVVEKSRDINSPIEIIFAGTINDDNGVEVILSGLMAEPEAAVNMVFYGDGDAASRVIAASTRDARIRYRQRISDAELDAVLVNADYLVCLRDPTSLASIYSFPSKLIKFMGSGTPVIANRFPGLDDDYADRLFLIPDFTGQAFSALVSDIARDRGGAGVGADAKSFIESRNDWGAIALELSEFLFPYNRKDA